MGFHTVRQHDRAVEWLLAGMMVSWGFYLFCAPEAFEAAQYTALRAIASPRTWATWSVCIGVLRLIALVINGQVRQTPLVRAGGAILGLIWWLVLLRLYVAAPGIPPAAISWFPLLAFAEAYSCIRTGADACVSGALGRRTLPSVR